MNEPLFPSTDPQNASKRPQRFQAPSLTSQGSKHSVHAGGVAKVVAGRFLGRGFGPPGSISITTWGGGAGWRAGPG